MFVQYFRCKIKVIYCIQMWFHWTISIIKVNDIHKKMLESLLGHNEKRKFSCLFYGYWCIKIWFHHFQSWQDAVLKLNLIELKLCLRVTLNFDFRATVNYMFLNVRIHAVGWWNLENIKGKEIHALRLYNDSNVRT